MSGSARRDAVLGRAGSHTPRYDAERLAAHVLGMQWSDIWPARLRRVDDGCARARAPSLRRRAAGEPLAYIEGSRGFYGLELACGPGVLVPRPETETARRRRARADRRASTSPIVVDIGTGTGAIALAIASQRVRTRRSSRPTSATTRSRTRDATRTTLGLDVWFARGDLFDALPRRAAGDASTSSCRTRRTSPDGHGAAGRRPRRAGGRAVRGSRRQRRARADRRRRRRRGCAPAARSCSRSASEPGRRPARRARCATTSPDVRASCGRRF